MKKLITILIGFTLLFEGFYGVLHPLAFLGAPNAYP